MNIKVVGNMPDILVGAQQAYAYLHGFHTRLADTVTQLISEIGRELKQDFAFAKASKIHNLHPSFRQNPYDRNARWVWDWLPLYEFTALFVDETSSAHGTLVIEARYETDIRWDGKHDTAPVMETARAENSSLVIYAWHHPEAGQNWRDAWTNSEWPKNDESISKGEGGFKCVRSSVGFLTLSDKVSIQMEAKRIALKISEMLDLSIEQ